MSARWWMQRVVVVGLVSVVAGCSGAPPQVSLKKTGAVAMALGTSRTITAADGITAITVPAPAVVVVVQSYAVISSTATGTGGVFPRDVPISLPGDGSGNPIFVAVVADGASPSQVMDVAKCMTAPATSCLVCMACYGCCLPPPVVIPIDAGMADPSPSPDSH